MQSTAANVDEYLETVPADRLAALQKLREIYHDKLGYDESMQYGMPAYSRDGVLRGAFNSQKNTISIYLMNKDVLDRYRSQVPDTGKGCIRYRRPDLMDFALIEQILTEAANTAAAA